MAPMLEARTLLLVITIVLICRAAILAYVWAVARRYGPIKYWAVGSALIAVGVLLIGLRGIAPDFASIIVAQAILMTGWMLITGGIVLAAGRSPPWRAGAVVTALTVAAVAWYALVTPDLLMRTAVVTATPVAFDVYAFIACLRFERGARRVTLRILAGLLLLLVVSNLVKTIYAIDSASIDLFQGSWQISQFYLLSVVSTVVGTVVFVLLATQRVQEELDLEIVEHQKDKRVIARSEAKYRQLYDATSDAVLTLNRARFTGCNGAALKLYGCATEEELCTYGPAALSPPTQPGGGSSLLLAQQYIDNALQQGRQDFEWVHRRADNGELFTAEIHLNSITLDGETSVQATARDISERKRMEESIRQLAFVDALTQLPNRRLLVDRMALAMSLSKRSRNYCALLFLDLDNFKPLNDTYGHDMGDLLLIEAASRLRGSVRAMDTVARFGGDEFVVLIGELSADRGESRAAAETVAAKILAVLSLPYILKAPTADGPARIVEHRCTASIGGTLFLGEDTNREEIVHQADAAMYAAKHAGRNTVRFADPAHHA